MVGRCIVGSPLVAAMETPKIGIAEYDEMKARTMAIARGEFQPAEGEPTVPGAGPGEPQGSAGGWSDHRRGVR